MIWCCHDHHIIHVPPAGGLTKVLGGLILLIAHIESVNKDLRYSWPGPRLVYVVNIRDKQLVDRINEPISSAYHIIDHIILYHRLHTTDPMYHHTRVQYHQNVRHYSLIWYDMIWHTSFTSFSMTILNTCNSKSSSLASNWLPYNVNMTTRRTSSMNLRETLGMSSER